MSLDDESGDREEMLAALEAHGRAFLQSFPKSANPARGTKRKRGVEIGSRAKGEESARASRLGSEDEWLGFTGDADNDQERSDLGVSVLDRRHTDRLTTEKSTVGPVVVDFSQSVRPRTSSDMTRLDKSFMSSKVSKVRRSSPVTADNAAERPEEEAEQLTDLRNDAELHRLVHTQLLSGSLDPSLDLTPAQKRKAMAGRVLEAAGMVKLGEGEHDVRKDEHNKAAKRIREGIRKKQKQQGHKALEEAKQLGNYHPTIKRLFSASSQPSTAQGKRERGIGSGVGRFVGGTLRISQGEIASVEGSGPNLRSRRSKDGGSRGRGARGSKRGSKRA